MGIVVRQSFTGTVMAYIGVAVGYLNTLFVRPYYLDMSQIGVLNLVTANAMLLAPFCAVGMPGVVIKYFPNVAQHKGHLQQLFTFLLSVVVLFNVVVLLLGWIFYQEIAFLVGGKESSYLAYLTVTFGIIVANSLFEVIAAFSKSMQNLAVPSFLQDVFIRLGTVAVVVLYGFNLLSFDATVQSLAVIYTSATLILWSYFIRVYGIRPTFEWSGLSGDFRKKLFYFGGFSMLLGGSYALINNVSYLQVAAILGDAANGIFATCFMIGIAMEIPRRNLLKVLAPLFSKAMHANAIEEVGVLYRKGAVTSSIISGGLFILIVTNLHDLYRLIPQGSEFATGFAVVVWVCAARLVVSLFSFSQEILVFSSSHKAALYLQLLAAVFLVVANVLLIPSFGLLGTGLAYFATLAFHSLLKAWLVYQRFHLLPFEQKLIDWVVITSLVLLATHYLPLSFHPIWNMALRSILIVGAYTLLIYIRNVSPDVNSLIAGVLSRFLKKKK